MNFLANPIVSAFSISLVLLLSGVGSAEHPLNAYHWPCIMPAIPHSSCKILVSYLTSQMLFSHRHNGDAIQLSLRVVL